MPKYFLSYSRGYDHLKEPFRRLLETLGSDVTIDIFDGPDEGAVSDIAVRKIQAADAFVVLYGPKESKTSHAAKWPYEETILARGMNKPIAMIVHQDTPLPESLNGHSTPPRFDFWDAESFRSNVHHVVKHLLDFQKRVSGIAASPTFRYRCVTTRQRVLSEQSTQFDVYHEVVAHRSCKVFQHTLHMAGDESISLPSPEALQYKLKKQIGPDAITLSLRFGNCTPHEIKYFVEATPGLEPGQVLGYWRSFEVPNPFPLTRAKIAERARNQAFPKWIPAYNYGDAWDVFYDIDTLTHAIHFPWEVQLKNCGIRVLHFRTREENMHESQRCEPMVRFYEDPSRSEKILEVNVSNPMINHSYFLLYEPKD